MKKTLISLLIIAACCLKMQGQTHAEEVALFQKELNEEFLNPEESPLSKKEMRKFKGHPFFAIDKKFRVEAKFVRADKSVPFKMKTTTDRLPVYEVYGKASFEIDDTTYTLTIYQSHKLREMEKYKDHLFLPYSDLTNAIESYGGGRFIDLTIPSGDTIVIDFNKSYNPSCAYNHAYSCPIPPEENDLNIRITAGVKALPY